MNKQLERLSKKIHKLRIALGYATHDQIEKGWKDEMKSTAIFIRDAKKNGFCSCGGFNYERTKSGSVRITLNTSFLYRTKK